MAQQRRDDDQLEGGSQDESEQRDPKRDLNLVAVEPEETDVLRKQTRRRVRRSEAKGGTFFNHEELDKLCDEATRQSGIGARLEEAVNQRNKRRAKDAASTEEDADDEDVREASAVAAVTVDGQGRRRPTTRQTSTKETTTMGNNDARRHQKEQEKIYEF